MKAWQVVSQYDDYAAIVFAETRGKAKNFALSLDCFEDNSFIELKAYRCPKADKYYRKGKTHLSWAIPKDRLILVKEFNFVCIDTPEEDECNKCIAKKYCLLN